MENQNELHYEQIIDTDGRVHERAKVPGGWFVRIFNDLPLDDDSDTPGSFMASYTAFFYPDPQHLWDGGSL